MKNLLLIIVTVTNLTSYVKTEKTLNEKLIDASENGIDGDLTIKLLLQETEIDINAKGYKY